MTPLSSYLKRQAMSQHGFARLLGVSAPTVCFWVSGTRRPGLRSALAIEQATRGAIPASYWLTTPPTAKEKRT